MLLLLLLCLATPLADTATARALHGEQQQCQPEFGSFAAGHWPAGCWRPYAPASPFNTPIPAHPRLAPDASAIAGYIVSQHWTFAREHHGDFALEATGSRPSTGRAAAIRWSA